MIRACQIYIWFVALLALFLGELRADTPAPVLSLASSDARVRHKAARKIAAEGETFVLRSSSRTDGVETEEYALEGQDPENWMELITCQRLSLSEVLNADEYVAVLKQHLLSSNPTATLRVLQTSPRAAVFGVEYKTEDPRAAQLAFVLVTALGTTHSREIQLIQYTARPGTMDFAQLQIRAKRWQMRFQSQALLTQADRLTQESK